ncbi:Uu.00g126630.m01.CDS01 [Anthostomella pinea]|uniref:Uu.00g126630.m01.CDS01 n=1 Tax=Anthostomella pinea TaxID=933095 RepID=A0AAI8VHX6_9PEZI|nr:Uu.00g126630.m01.CDS01 [Anthostomella pinea]
MSSEHPMKAHSSAGCIIAVPSPDGYLKTLTSNQTLCQQYSAVGKDFCRMSTQLRAYWNTTSSSCPPQMIQCHQLLHQDATSSSSETPVVSHASMFSSNDPIGGSPAGIDGELTTAVLAVVAGLAVLMSVVLYVYICRRRCRSCRKEDEELYDMARLFV